MVYDVTSASLHTALRGLSDRRRVLAENIANIDTPGYLAGRVEFESSLQQALDRVGRGNADPGAPSRVAPARQTSVEPTRLNGNNVTLDDEIMLQEQTELAYQTVLEASNARFRLLRTAIGTSA